MISKNQIKKIATLSQKKLRLEQNCFVAEGTKSVMDIAALIQPISVYATNKWIGLNASTKLIAEEVSEMDLKKMSQLKTPQGVLAVFPMPNWMFDEISQENELILALDDVQDPGNMGTILRLADWFGIKTVICTKGCVDVFNPKVVQATMGSIVRVKVFYVDLATYLENSSCPIYGAFMDGESVYAKQLSKTGIVVMGNEGKGISEEIAQHIKFRISIPSFSGGVTGAESLNVATATAIICSEFRRTK